MPRELKRVDISNNLLNDKAIKAIAKYCGKNKENELDIDLEGNAISREGFFKLSGLLSYGGDVDSI